MKRYIDQKIKIVSSFRGMCQLNSICFIHVVRFNLTVAFRWHYMFCQRTIKCHQFWFKNSKSISMLQPHRHIIAMLCADVTKLYYLDCNHFWMELSLTSVWISGSMAVYSFSSFFFFFFVCCIHHRYIIALSINYVKCVPIKWSIQSTKSQFTIILCILVHIIQKPKFVSIFDWK